MQGLDDLEVPVLDLEKPDKALRLRSFLQDAQERLLARTKEIGELEAELEELAADYEGADKEVAELLEELGECPTCGAQLDHGGCE